MTRRHSYLAAAAAVLVGLAGSAATAQSDVSGPTQVLPDMSQRLPSGVQIAQVSGTWRLGFASEVANNGPGYLKITGNGPGNAPMVADQIIQMSDGSTTTVPGVGEMHYVIGGGHEHWHLLDFERYELRSPSDSAQTIVKDQKTGFCLANAFTTDICGRNHPEYTTVSEGLAVGGTDKYLGYLEGQYLVLDPTTTPAGDYLLVNRVNATGALVDADPSDNAASLRLQLTWNSGGQPSVTVTNSCLASIDCPPPPPQPLPDPQPEPQPETQAPQQQTTVDSVVPVPASQPVPVVSASHFAPATAKPTMSRSMAGRLVRKAIQKATKQLPQRLRTTCKRRSVETFACASTWHGANNVRWSGHIRVWYREHRGALSWFYDLAARRAGGKPVVRRSIRGSASRSVFSGPGGALYCARIE